MFIVRQMYVWCIVYMLVVRLESPHNMAVVLPLCYGHLFCRDCYLVIVEVYISTSHRKCLSCS